MSFSKESDWGLSEVGDVHIDNLKKEVLGFHEEWLLDTSRQKMFMTHEHTFMYKLQDFEFNWNPGLPIRSVKANTLGEKSELELLGIYKLLESYADGIVVNAEIISMNPKSRIRMHKDRGNSLYVVRRFHIPIKTNQQVFFTVDGKKYNLAEGNAYELNNAKYHSVRNDSDEIRIHLIVDVMPSEYYEKSSLNLVNNNERYLCPFCVSSWTCHGPHVESKDLEEYTKKIKFIQEDLSECAKEEILKGSKNLTAVELAEAVGQFLLNRKFY